MARQWLVVTGIVATVLGAVLRIAGARGDFWLDEIITLTHLDPLTSMWQIFYKDSNDNNHILNSIYIYLLGQDRIPLHVRALSILCGTLAIPAAGLAAAGPENDRIRAAAAMVFFAIAFPMVYYGSEARGYAGFELCALLSIHAASLHGHRRWKPLYIGAVTLAGTLFHPLMLVFVAGQAAVCFLLNLPGKKSLFAAAKQAFLDFYPAAIVFLIYIFYMVILYRYFDYKIMIYSPTMILSFINVYISLPYEIFGFYKDRNYGFYINNSAFLLVLSLCFIIFCYKRNQTSRFMQISYWIYLVCIPMAFLALRLPILHSPRYFFFCWIWIILLYCDYVSTEIRRPQARALLIILALVIAVQNVRSSIRLADTGRGEYAHLVAAMKGPAPALYSLARPVFQQPVIDYFARIESVDITYLPRDRWCETKPEWLILDTMEMPAEASYGPTGCQARFRRVGIYPAWGFGVEPWGLYQILPP